MRTALYAGSFDPLTNGHLDVVSRASRLVERLVIAVGVHASKAPLFQPNERIAMITECCRPVCQQSGCELAVTTFAGLVVEAARDAGTTVMIRGLRDGTDFDYEMQMAGMNAQLAPGIETLFLPAAVGVRPIAATLVRQIAAMGGDVKPFVPAAVAAKLARRFGRDDREEFA